MSKGRKRKMLKEERKINKNQGSSKIGITWGVRI